MKRLMQLAVFVLAAYPALALASIQPINPPWVRPIDPRTGIPSATVVQTGAYSAPYGGADVRGATFLGRATLGLMSINVSVHMHDEAGLERYAAQVSDPRSLYYRRFLTPQQIADNFGATQPDYTRAMQYFWANGLAVRSWRQREMLGVVGPQAAMERALGTQFGWFRKNGITFYAPMNAPRFSAPLPLDGIGGAVTYRHMRRHYDVGGSILPFQGFGPGTLAGNSPFDLAAAFDYTGAYVINGSCCKGDGIVIGIVGTGPISAFDVPAFRSLFHVSGTGGVNQVDVTAPMTCCYSTGLATPPPVTAPCGGPLPGCNPEDLEAQLDTEQTSSLAPNATVDFYLAYNPAECFAPGPPTCGSPQPALGIAESDDELQQIASDNVADVVSGSYGIGERDFANPANPILTCPMATPSGCGGADPAIFATLAAQGIAVFFSSGDSGAAGCQRDGFSTADELCVSYPSDDWNVVSVGGTTTPIGSDGRLTGVVSVWGVLTQTNGGGGGGFSVSLNRPAFERAGMFCDSKGVHCDSSHRLQPDLSLNADPATADAFLFNCGGPLPACAGLGGAFTASIGGTSASAPDMAAMWALVLEACQQEPACNSRGPAGHSYRLGNPAPLLYGLNAAAKSSAFYDVVFGNNAVPLSSSPGNYTMLTPGFNAKAGFDLATGLGAPFARNLIKAVTGM